jgi:hypothetical protein
LKKNKCTNCDNKPIIVAKDKNEQSEYRAKNDGKKECCKIRVDGCLITIGTRCDFLILNCCDKTAFFVELKGSDLVKSIRQIDASITQLSEQLKDFKLYARSVLRKVRSPALNSSDERKLKKKLRKINGSDDKCKLVIYKSGGKMEEKI